MKKLVSLLLALLMLGSMVACTGDDTPDTTEDTTGDVLEGGEETAEDTVEETEAETSIDDLFGGIEDGHFTKGVTAKTIYYMNPTTLWSYANSDFMLLGTLQGLVAKYSDEQFYLMHNEENTAYVRSVTERDWGVTWSDTVDGKEVTVENLVAHYADKNIFKGYILCSETNDDIGSSVYVAISIAGLIDAVVVTEDNKALLDNLGYECLLDVSDKDDAWLRQSEYWDQLDKDIAVERLYKVNKEYHGVPNYGGLPGLIDLAVLNGAYYTIYDGYVEAEHSAHFEYLNDDAYIFGWYIPIGEGPLVSSLGSINAGIIPADNVKNFSVLSGFSLETIKQERVSNASTEAENVHTVTLIYTDGDNTWWFAEGPFITTDRYMYHDPDRNFDVGWGLPPTSLDLMGPVATYLYDTKSPEHDEFIMSLNGTSYTYGTRWSKEARAEMTEKLAQYMERMDLRYMVMLEDSGWQEEYFADFTEHDAIEGIFYVGSDNKNGNVIWTNGKPTVGCRSGFTGGRDGGIYDQIQAWLNRKTLSTDPAKTRSYSMYYVGAWCTYMDVITQFVSELPDNVEVVTPSEFMDRLVANCKPTEE